MKPIKLFATKIRSEAHQKLQEIIDSGEYPMACCREDEGNEQEPYTVWSNNEVPKGWD